MKSRSTRSRSHAPSNAAQHSKQETATAAESYMDRSMVVVAGSTYYYDARVLHHHP